MKAKFKVINGFDIKFEDKDKFKKKQFYTDKVELDIGDLSVKIKKNDDGKLVIFGSFLEAKVNSDCIEIY